MAYSKELELLSNVKDTGDVADHTYGEYMAALNELKSAEAHAHLRKDIYDSAMQAYAVARNKLFHFKEEREAKMTELRPLRGTTLFACPHCDLVFKNRSDGTYINGAYYCDTCLEEEENDRPEEALANE